MNKKKSNGIRNIAAAAGVSPATVSRVLNNSGLVSPEVCGRVLKVARELGGNPRSRLKLISFLVTDERFKFGDYSFRILEELRREATERGFRWQLIAADQLDILEERSVTGIISLDYRNRIAEKWRNRAFPLVCINDAARCLDGVHSVYSAEYSGIRQAVNHLVGFGHQRIGLLQIGGRNVLASKHREEAFFQLGQVYRLREHFFSEWGCVPIDDCNCPTVIDGALDRLLERKITALILPGEGTVYDFVDASRRRGLLIPEELSVISWESVVSGYLSPAMTTVEQNFPELARRAMETLEAQINHVPIPLGTAVPYLFHPRESVMVPAQPHRGRAGKKSSGVSAGIS